MASENDQRRIALADRDEAVQERAELKTLDSSHAKLDTKISSLEKKTRDQLFNLNQSMKERFALERSECLDRMDRRALRERIAIERQQAVRDVGLKRDLATLSEHRKKPAGRGKPQEDK